MFAHHTEKMQPDACQCIGTDAQWGCGDPTNVESHPKDPHAEGAFLCALVLPTKHRCQFVEQFVC